MRSLRNSTLTALALGFLLATAPIAAEARIAANGKNLNGVAPDGVVVERISSNGSAARGTAPERISANGKAKSGTLVRESASGSSDGFVLRGVRLPNARTVELGKER